ncbi:MAG TPA: hypothetical protein VFT16_05810 [Candidatus Saccharimonadales bacterium]|nr:hypothetical protein [Candidatus Saccharimonadales bacterium]
MKAIDLTLPEGVEIAPHADLVHQPDFWDPRKAYAWYSPDIDGAFIEGVKFRRHHNLRTAAQLEQDGISNIAMLTDLQFDFRDEGRLPVQGTDDVVLRCCTRLLNGTIGTDYYTGFVYSQDGHVPYHISYATRWRTTDGSPFDLRNNKAAVLNLVDEKMGVFQATCFDPADGSPIDMGYIQSMLNIKDTVAYWNYLQQTGQGPVWIFAGHCKLGTDGVNLHPLLSETLAFIEGARFVAPVPVSKGHIRDTDWFGPLEPCRPDPTHPQGGFQKAIVDLFAQAKGWVEFFGVAEDFCNFNMQKQVMRFFDGTPFFNQMAFATDGTAAIVPNAPHVLALYDEAQSKGVRFFTHDQPFATTA